MKKEYLPKREADRVGWLNNFSSIIGNYATTFGISPAEVATIGKMAAFYAYIYNLMIMVSTFSKNLTKFKNLLSIAPNGTTLGPMPTLTPPAAPGTSPAGIFTFISGIVGRIKSNTANYTEAIGYDLGIIGEEISFKEAEFKSVISAEAASFLNFYENQNQSITRKQSTVPPKPHCLSKVESVLQQQCR